MPKIDKEPPIGTWKFVRDGDVIVYDDRSLQHHDIAASHHLGKPGLDTFLVDDAGLLDVGSRVSLAGKTSSLALKKPSENGRIETVEIVKRYTAKQVESC